MNRSRAVAHAPAPTYAGPMSQNPYADPGADVFPEAERTSVMAILSLVCSIICCIPGLGVLGVLLGVFSLIGIGGSGGRVRGKGLAIAGIILGLLATTLWVGMYMLVSADAKQSTKYWQFVEALERDDTAAARGWLLADTDALLSDQQLASWSDAIEGEYGAVVSGPSGVWTVYSAQFNPDNQPMMQELQQTYLSDFASMMSNTPRVVPIEFDQGQLTIAFLVRPTELNAEGLPPIINALYLAPDGSSVWLVDPAATASPAPAQPQGQPQDQDPLPGDEVSAPEADPEGDDAP